MEGIGLILAVVDREPGGAQGENGADGQEGGRPVAADGEEGPRSRKTGQRQSGRGGRREGQRRGRADAERESGCQKNERGRAGP
jgi:hypothetical protein